MHKKALLILALVAVAAIIAAVWLTHQRRAVTSADTGGPLVAGLREAVNSVTRVRLEDGDQTVTLERGENGWHIAERGGYPADLQQLRRKLLALSESKLIEKKTANPDNYALLRVADPQPEEEGAGAEEQGTDTREATRLSLEGLPEPLSLIIGMGNFRGTQSTYVRRAGQAQSWLASGDLSMSPDPKEWLKRDIMDVGAPRVRRVALSHPDGSVLTIQKATRETPNFELEDLPAGRELLSPSAANSIAGALGNLRLDDVQAVAEADAGEAAAVNGIFETFDGLRVHTRAWERDEQRYLTLKVEFDPTLIPPQPEAAPAVEAVESVEPDAADGSGEDAEFPEVPVEQPAEEPEGAVDQTALAAEAEALAAAVGGWVFVIPSYKYGNLTKELEDLLKPLESEDAAE